MPAVTLNLYDIFRRKQSSGNGAVNLSSVTVKCMIVTGTYTPNQNTHDFRDDLGANEVSGSNYTAGGNAMINPVVSLSGAGLVTVDFDDPATWAQHATGFSNGRRAVVYVARGGLSSADELIGYTDDFGADKGNVDGDFSVAVNASGLFTGAR
jgi:hypothetical protein